MSISTRQQLYNSLQSLAQCTQIPTRLHNFMKKTLLENITITLSSMSNKVQEWLKVRGMSDYRNGSIPDVKNMVMYIMYKKTYRMINEINILNEIIEVIEGYKLHDVGIISIDCRQSFQERLKDAIDKNIEKANKKKKGSKGKISTKKKKQSRKKKKESNSSKASPNAKRKKSRKNTESSSDEEEDEDEDDEHNQTDRPKKKKSCDHRRSLKDVSKLRSENQQLKSAVESLKEQIADLIDDKTILFKRVTKLKSIKKTKRELSNLNDTPEFRS